eukprot:8187172-Alexandrium_andersonii.AAC.1
MIRSLAAASAGLKGGACASAAPSRPSSCRPSRLVAAAGRRASTESRLAPVRRLRLTHSCPTKEDN